MAGDARQPFQQKQRANADHHVGNGAVQQNAVRVFQLERHGLNNDEAAHQQQNALQPGALFAIGAVEV